MRKILIFIDHDIIIRHFILSNVLVDLKRTFDVVLVLPRSHGRVKKAVCIPPDWCIEEIDIDEKRAHQLRRLFQINMFARIRNWKLADKKNAQDMWMNSLGWKAYLITQLLSFPIIKQINQFLKLAIIGECPEIARLVEKHNPVAFLHPTVLEGLFASDLILTGKKRKIPTVYLMNSWDNPSTKASALGHPDILGVWGEQTKRHAMYYTSVPESHIRIIGSAQFEVYKNPPKVSREEYRNMLNIGLNEKIILYAGSSKGVNETRQLQVLENAVAEGVLPKCKIVYRPHPWRAFPEGEMDFFDYNWTNVVMDPQAIPCYQSGRSAGGINIELADYTDAHVILNAIDCILSPLSTILLEKDVSENLFLRTMAGWVHFHDYFDRMEGFVAKSEFEIIDCCKQMLQSLSDNHLKARLIEKTQFFVSRNTKSYAHVVANLINT